MESGTYKRSKAFYRSAAIAGLMATILICIYCNRIGLFSSADALSRAIGKLGVWGPLLFILIQIVQVVIPIIPGGISCAAGVILFGPGWGFLYNYVGILIGSAIAFLMTRKLGRTFLQNITSPKTYDKYIGWLDERNHFDKMFAIAIFLPVAPDDFLCMLAGITKMKFAKFCAILVLCKPCSIFLYSLGLASVTNLVLDF